MDHSPTFQSRSAPIPFWAVMLSGLVLGAAAYGLLYGFASLNPFQDNWILHGYNETDIIQHYAGWCAFRNSPWSFPLGLAQTMGLGTCISFTDSVPLAAVLAKVLLQLTGYTGTFQYFGLYTLFCYVAQSVAAGLLARRKTSSPLLIGLSMVLLCFSPILMERAVRHTALGSQWLILLALYGYLTCREKGYPRYPFLFWVLAALAICLHPYFVPLVFIFALVTALNGGLSTRRWGHFLGMFAGNLITCTGVGVLFGVLGSGVESSRWGFGYFSMNLNALVNPLSSGGYKWSSFLPVLPQTGGNYDGFNYLGLGLMVLILWGLGRSLAKGTLKKTLLSHAFFLPAMAGMTLFALSNVVTLNGGELFTIPLPEFLLSLCGIFRASSRMFYAVYYSLVIYALYSVYPSGEKSAKGWDPWRTAALGLSLVVVIQGADLWHVFPEKRAEMAEKMDVPSLLEDQNLEQRLKEYSYLAADPAFTVWDTDARVASVLALKYGLTILFSVANSGDYSQAQGLAESRWADLQAGSPQPDTAFETHDPKLVQAVVQANPGLEVYEGDGFWFLFPAR